MEFHESLDAACSQNALTPDERERLRPRLEELQGRGVVRLDWGGGGRVLNKYRPRRG